MQIALALVAAYLLGSVPFAMISSKLFGLADPQQRKREVAEEKEEKKSWKGIEKEGVIERREIANKRREGEKKEGLD